VGAGAKALADALCVNTTLTELDISANGIGKEGASHVARALTRNCSLRVLHLHGNVLKEDGPKHIAKALQVPRVLLPGLL
jgi:Ran GTPase-activating protein (RanGAP) involved in mRNA processing and transport